MKTISTTDARKNLSRVVYEVHRTGHAVGLARHGRVVAYLSPAPQWNTKLSDTTNLGALSHAFDFLESEPDLYSDADLRKRYA